MIVKHLSETVPEREGDFTRWYLSRADRGHSLAVRYVELTGMVPPHTHDVEETILYIAGKGLARAGGKEGRDEPGTMVVCRRGSAPSSVREGLERHRKLAIFVGSTGPEKQHADE